MKEDKIASEQKEIDLNDRILSLTFEKDLIEKRKVDDLAETKNVEFNAKSFENELEDGF